MKRVFPWFAAWMVASASAVACSGGGSSEGTTAGEAATKRALDGAEIEMLLHMRQEEKLARDVYLTMLDFAPFVENIVSSEERHMGAVLGLLQRYDLPDPVADMSQGRFASAEFQTLHDQLVARAARSREEAMRVGAEIEELDLKDLEEAIAETDRDDIRFVYENLARGSRNHLRRFDAALVSMGAAYEPKHLAVETYRAIASSPMEQGRGRRASTNLHRHHATGGD